MHDFNARNTRILTDFVQNMRFWVQIRYKLKCAKTALLEKRLTRKWIKRRFTLCFTNLIGSKNGPHSQKSILSWHLQKAFIAFKKKNQILVHLALEMEKDVPEKKAGRTSVPNSRTKCIISSKNQMKSCLNGLEKILVGIELLNSCLLC